MPSTRRLMNLHTYLTPLLRSYTIVCDTGFYWGASEDVFVRSFQSTCRADKNMSNSSQTCEPITCQLPNVSGPVAYAAVGTAENPPNVSEIVPLASDNSTTNGTIIVKFNKTYWVSCKNGSWVASGRYAYCSDTTTRLVSCGVTPAPRGFATCQPRGCDLAEYQAQLANTGTVDVAPQMVLGGTNITVTCSAGYRPNSTNVSLPIQAHTFCSAETCGFDIECTKITCRQPYTSLGNTTITPATPSVIPFEDSVNISCIPDYMVPVESQNRVCQTVFSLQCQADGLTGSSVGTSRCVPKTCAMAPLLSALALRNATLATQQETSAMNLNSSVFMWCGVGSRPNSNSSAANRSRQLFCGSDCSFGDIPQCVPVQCNASTFRASNGTVTGCV